MGCVKWIREDDGPRTASAHLNAGVVVTRSGIFHEPYVLQGAIQYVPVELREHDLSRAQYSERSDALLLATHCASPSNIWLERVDGRVFDVLGMLYPRMIWLRRLRAERCTAHRQGL